MEKEESKQQYFLSIEDLENFESLILSEIESAKKRVKMRRLEPKQIHSLVLEKFKAIHEDLGASIIGWEADFSLDKKLGNFSEIEQPQSVNQQKE